jgi:stage III sporulation protein AB
MWLKWLGALMILSAALAWGNCQAVRLQRRLAEIEEFRTALRLLVAEIGYTATPLPRAVDHVISRLRRPQVCAFFKQVRISLDGSEHVTSAAAAWADAAAGCRSKMDLGRQDWDVLLRAAAGLGGLGRENQVKQLELAEAQLGHLAAEAAANCRNGEKMWRYLGAMGGLAIVILLL